MSTIYIPIKQMNDCFIINHKGGITRNQKNLIYDPDHSINLGLFATYNNQNVQYLESFNKKSGYRGSVRGIGFKNGVQLIWTDKDSAYQDKDIIHFIGGAPTLTAHSKIFIDWGNLKSNYLRQKHKRSFIGFNNTHLMIGSTDKRVTIEELARIALYKGCDYSVAVDGGGSCDLYSLGKQYKRTYRKIPSWLIVHMKKGGEIIKIVCPTCGTELIIK